MNFRRAILIKNQQGFTLLEIAIVMIIIGILTGGGISLMKILTERKARNATMTHLQQTRSALINFSVINGRLPFADNDGDGIENNMATNGALPYLTLQMQPSDSYKRFLRYEVNAGLIIDRAGTCSALRNGLNPGDRPRVVDADGSGTAFEVAAVLSSAGPMDANGNGNPFDALTGGTHQGNNVSGTPNYLRHPPVATFDDLTTYIGGYEIVGQVCEYLDLSVTNNTGSMVHVYDVNQASDIGSVSGGDSEPYTVISGTRIELRDAANGSGSVINPTTPQTPIVLVGQSYPMTVP